MITYSQYNNGMMSDEMIQVRNPRLLNVTVYLMVIMMCSIALISLPDEISKISAISLCVAFGLVHAFGFRRASTPGQLAVYFVIQLILILALMWLSYPSDVFNLFFYLLAVEAVLVLPTRLAIAWTTSFFLVDSLIVLLSRGLNGFIPVLFYAAAFLLTAVFGYSLRQAEIAHRQNQQLLDELKAAQHRLQDQAVNEERTRLAREMHDSLGHSLTVAIVQLEGAQRLIPTDPDRAARMIGTMRDEMKEALAELRRTVTALRTPISDELPLDIALSNLTQSFQQDTGIPTVFSVSSGFPSLPGSYRLALYRTAQEALTNIQRHAMAKNAWIRLDADDHEVILVIEDDGKGLVEGIENAAGSGILGQRERAAQLGGEIRIGERTGGGAQLVFSVPQPVKESDA